MNRLKKHHFLPKLIDLNQIDLAPGPYCMSYGFDVALLADSIRRIGLMNSPILIEKGKGRGDTQFVVVAGFRRISALALLGEALIPSRILPMDTPPFECLQMNLHENLIVRDFNPVEKGMALKRLLALVPEKEVLKVFMPLFDLPSHAETLHLFMGIETEFVRLAKDLMAHGYLSLQAARLLLEMDSTSRDKFCKYFSIVTFNKNQQTQFIDYAMDLSRIERVEITRLLDAPELLNIRDNAQMNNPQKAKAFIKLLRARRLPHLVSAEKGFKRMVEKLALPKGCQISAPPFFEGPHYRLEISFETGKDLKKKLFDLSVNGRLLTFDDPWNRNA
jgi:hypothetical protein